MIIVEVTGGLGNQMFQYALYRKLQLLGKKVKLDLSNLAYLSFRLRLLPDRKSVV